MNRYSGPVKQVTPLLFNMSRERTLVRFTEITGRTPTDEFTTLP